MTAVVAEGRLAELRAAFPEALIWHGPYTGSLWAYVRERTGAARLVEAATPEEMAHLLYTARLWGTLRQSVAAGPEVPKSRQDGAWSSMPDACRVQGDGVQRPSALAGRRPPTRNQRGPSMQGGPAASGPSGRRPPEPGASSRWRTTASHSVARPVAAAPGGRRAVRRRRGAWLRRLLGGPDAAQAR